jgi:hypothetical protein
MLGLRRKAVPKDWRQQMNEIFEDEDDIYICLRKLQARGIPFHGWRIFLALSSAHSKKHPSER